MLCFKPQLPSLAVQVLRLLLVAWDRRLIFSVGTSSTTGESDTVIWNEVHHKTEFGSNLTGHGYPDPGHLDNVLEELKAQGINEEECLLRDWVEETGETTDTKKTSAAEMDPWMGGYRLSRTSRTTDERTHTGNRTLDRKRTRTLENTC